VSDELPRCYADIRTDEILRIVEQATGADTDTLAAMREQVKAVVIEIETDMY
jgi:hypothetical protein